MSNHFFTGIGKRYLQDSLWNQVKYDPVSKMVINIESGEPAAGVCQVTIRPSTEPMHTEAPFIHQRVLPRQTKARKKLKGKSKLKKPPRKMQTVSLESACSKCCLKANPNQPCENHTQEEREFQTTILFR